MTRPWITIIGIGEDGLAGLTESARDIIKAADHVVGSARQIGLIGPPRARLHPWPTPLDQLFPIIESWRDSPTVILASGDPMTYGIAKMLLGHFGPEPVTILPHISAFSLAAAKLGWPLQDVDTVSLHGRPVSLIEPLIQPGNRILALTTDRRTILDVAGRLQRRGFGSSRLTVLEHLSGPEQKITSFLARDAAADRTQSDFHTLAVECHAAPGALVLPRLAGLPDDAFQHDGQLTKSEVRAVTLAALAPAPDQLLWDIGAGCGSVAIEWVRAARNAAALAFEQSPARIALIAANADALGAPAPLLEIVPGAAPESLAGHPAPDAVFIGGGLTRTGMLETGFDRLKPGGRLVANAVTLAGEAKLMQAQDELGGDLRRLDIAELDHLGAHQVLRPRLAVLQWRISKPW